MLTILKTMTNELMNNGFIDRFNGLLKHHQFQEGLGADLLHSYQSNVELQCTITKEHNSNFFSNMEGINNICGPKLPILRDGMISIVHKS